MKTKNIKIGISKEPDKRKKELQVGNSSKLKVVYVIENVPICIEKHVHGICQQYKINGEWFKSEVINHLIKNPWFKENIQKA
jgi:hypothetical protein